MLHGHVERLEQELKRKENEVHAELTTPPDGPPLSPPSSERRASNLAGLSSTPNASATKLPVVSEVIGFCVYVVVVCVCVCVCV
jgi:hypothetical protein